MNAPMLSRFRTLHTWTGLVGALVLFLVFCAGSLTVFHSSIRAWEAPIQASAQKSLEPQSLLSAVMKRHPELKGNVSMLLAGEGRSHPLAYWLDASSQRWVFTGLQDLEGNRPGRAEADPGLAHFFNELHRCLGLGSAGTMALGFICLLYALALLSGIFLYLPVMLRRFLSISTRGGARRFWGDVHGVLGFLSLPFHLIFAVTGVLFSLFMVLVMGLDFSVLQGQLAPRMDALVGLVVTAKPSGEVAPMVSLEDLLASGRRHAPTLEVEAIRFHHWGDRAAQAELMGHQPGAVGSWGMMLLDGRDGALIQQQRPGARDLNHAVLSTLYGLHFGDFGGLGLRWAYFLLGLSGAGLFLSGQIVWIEARAKGSGTAQRARVMARITTGFCAGTLLGLVALFPLVRIVDGLGGSSLVGAEGLLRSAFFGLLGVSMVLALRHSPSRFGPWAVALAGGLGLCIPMLDALFKRAWTGVDLAALFFGVLMILGSRALQKRMDLSPQSPWH